MGQFFHRARSVQAAVIAQASTAKTLHTFTHPNPRILLELPDIFFDHDGNEKLHRFETDAIHLCRGAKHGIGSHSQGPETLLPIAQRRVDERNFAHGEKNGVMGVGKPSPPILHHSSTSSYLFILLCSNSLRIE